MEKSEGGSSKLEGEKLEAGSGRLRRVALIIW
jgi:hypothetical protein